MVEKFIRPMNVKETLEHRAKRLKDFDDTIQSWVNDPDMALMPWCIATDESLWKTREYLLRVRRETLLLISTLKLETEK
jgi:RimJ/RimL family protein N-acetyltransferase